MSSVRFAHVALNCRDMAVIERFYVKHFGFRRARLVDLGDDKSVFLRSGDTYLELFQSKQDPPAPAPERDGPTWPGVRHLAFQVDNVDAKLQEMGSAANVSLGPFNFNDFIPGWRAAWLRDPEGNIVEISQGFKDQESPPPLA
jgi:glyoxylase I family protein